MNKFEWGKSTFVAALITVFAVLCIIKIAQAGYSFGRWLQPVQATTPLK